jgi:ligand-binding sensor protein
MELKTIIAFSSAISALATFVIAGYAIVSHQLSKKIDESVSTHQKTTEKLIDDLKIALLMTATTCRSASAAKTIYDEYKGQFLLIE